MPKIDFKKISTPLSFVKELMKGYSEREIKDAQENFSEFLNTVQEIHRREIASKVKCDKVNNR